MNILDLIGREAELFNEDLENSRHMIDAIVMKSRFLVVGGAGSIGLSVVKEIAIRNPKSLDVVDISENNLVELVRQLRSTQGGDTLNLRTFCVDCGSLEFEAFFLNEGAYDYVFNLSAMKHVRSEKDPYTLMRLINVNIFNSVKLARLCSSANVKKYFCVSTDKATNPVNMMGASKRIMELFLNRESLSQCISMARFANVAFSDGSLLYGFEKRITLRQPISAPFDVMRYFVTPKESGLLCLLSALLGENRDIFFPKLSEKLHLTTFSDIAERYLAAKGFTPYLCKSEEEAKLSVNELNARNAWPCFFFKSDTTGEKSFEEFYTSDDKLDMDRYLSIGVIQSSPTVDFDLLDDFEKRIHEFTGRGNWNKNELVELFKQVLPTFGHIEKGKNLDQRM